jgi:hypothetical protein
MMVRPMRGTTVGGTNIYSTISLANNATTTFHTIQGDAGTGGWLSGTIKIDATTDYAIPFFCFFSRQLDGTTYNVAASYGSDIPSGLSITNSGSAVRVVMPNLAGFSSASVTYCVQAAANGTTLPVSVSASSVLGSTSGVAPAAGVIGQKLEDTGGTLSYGSMSTTAWTDTGATISSGFTNGVWLVWGFVRAQTGGADTALPGICEIQMIVGATTYEVNAATVYDNNTGGGYVFTCTVAPEHVVNAAGSITAKLQARRPSGVFDILHSRITATRIG